MRIPENEIWRPLVEAIQEATGRRPHLSTAIRWCQKRNRYGNKLESWLCGGRRGTSVEAVRRYNERNTIAADSDSPITISTHRQQAAAHSAAMKELDRELGAVPK